MENMIGFAKGVGYTILVAIHTPHFPLASQYIRQ